MAETEEQRKQALHEKYGAKPKAKGDSEDDGETKGSKGKRGRPKKTNADRHQDEIDTGRRTSGRSGTGDFLGGREKKTPPRSQSVGVQAEKPKPDPTKLANKVIADTAPAAPIAPPLAPPMPNGRQATLTKVLAASGAPEVSNRAPAWAQFASSRDDPFSLLGPMTPKPNALPPIDFERDVAPPGRGPSVGMQTASGAPAPKRVKTVSISPPSISATKPVDQSKAGTGESKGKTLKAKPKSTKDRLADQISKDDVGANDYYEQLKRGGFNLSK